MTKKQIDTLVGDIYTVLECGVEVPDDLLKEFTGHLGDLVYKTLKREPPHKGLRLSGVGKPVCQQWYDKRVEYEEELSGPTRFKFLYGDIIEQVVVLLSKLAGHKVTNEQLKVTVSGVNGHLDCIIDDAVVDVKSTSVYGFRKFQDGSIIRDDPFGYIPQISSYNKAVTNNEKPCHFLAVNKVTGELHLTTLEDIDQVDAEQYISKVKKIIAAPKLSKSLCVEAVPDGKSGNLKLDTVCFYCRHKFDCWQNANDGSGLRIFNYSTGPRYLTDIKREPNVEEIPQQI